MAAIFIARRPIYMRFLRLVTIENGFHSEALFCQLKWRIKVYNILMYNIYNRKTGRFLLAISQSSLTPYGVGFDG